MRIDSHQHFWKYDAVAYYWIGNGMESIRKDFFPADVRNALHDNHFDGCVAVQSEENDAHNSFLLSLADEHDFIMGVVGWIDLRDQHLNEKLEYLEIFPKLKGFRHILQGKGEAMLDDAFVRGLHAMGGKGYSYDILVYHDQLQHVNTLLKRCPDQRFVLDHLGKPGIKNGEITEWKKNIRELASYPNLYCKVSGMVTEAGWSNWKKEDFWPYLETIVNEFGIDRLMFGSDWPVCLVAAQYDQVAEIVSDYFSSFSDAAKDKLFGLNAIDFYNLK